MADKQQMLPKRGEVYLVNFGSTIGSEINKTRPAVVLQTAKTYPTLTIVAPFTSKVHKRMLSTAVLVNANEGGLDYDSVVLLD